MSFLKELRKTYRGERPAPVKEVAPAEQPETPIIIPEFSHLTGRCALLCDFGKIDRHRATYHRFEEMYRDAIRGDNIPLAQDCSLAKNGYMCPGLAWIIAVNRLLAPANQQ